MKERVLLQATEKKKQTIITRTTGRQWVRDKE